jgi:tetratricopeptide (TPR) repeat protein
MKVIVIIFYLFIVGTNHSVAQSIDDLLAKAETARNSLDVNKTVDLYTQVIKLDSLNVEAYYYRGWIQSLFNKKQGLEDFIMTIKLDSLHSGAHYSLYNYYSFAGDNTKADYYMMKYAELSPKNSTTLLYLSSRSIEKGDLIKAINYCNEAISLEEEHNRWTPLLVRAEIQFALKEYKSAIDDFELCFNTYSYGMYSAKNFEMCGDAYEFLKQMDKACEKWNLAINHIDVEIPSKTAKQKIKTNCHK